MAESAFLSFAVATALITLLPGPDTFLVVRSALARGKTAGIAAAAGIGTGLFVHATVASTGLSAILVRSANLAATVKILGAIYLAALGIMTVSSAFRDNQAVPENPGRTVSQNPLRAFGEGFFGNILNPKVSVFYLAFLPQFIGPDDPVFTRFLFLASVHCLMTVVWLGLLSLFIDRSLSLIRDTAAGKAVRAAAGTALTAFGVRLALAPT